MDTVLKTNKHNGMTVGQLVIVTFFALISIPYHGSPFLSGLDGSWSLILNYLSFSDFKFGSDIFFTYGPLGFICAAVYRGRNFWIAHMIWIIIYLIQMVTVVKIIRKKNNNIYILASFLMMYAIGFPRGGDYLCYLLMLNLLLLWSGDKKAGIIASLIAVLLFFVKFSNAIFAFTTIIAFTIMTYIKEGKGTGLKPFLIIPLAIMGGYLVYNPSLFDFLNYIRGAVEISSGYTTAMSISQNDAYVIWVILIVVLYLIIGCIMYKKKRDVALMFVWYAPGLFLLYKHGFVRADGHVFLSFRGMFWVLSSMMLYIGVEEQNDIIAQKLISGNHVNINLASRIARGHFFRQFSAAHLLGGGGQ